MATIRKLFVLFFTTVASFSASTNDFFTNRVILTGTSPLASANFSGATTEPGEPHNLPASLWWEWTSLTNSGMSFESPTGPTALVYTGQWPNLTLVSAPAPRSPYGTRFVSFRAEEGTTYYLAAAGQTNYTGNISIRLRPAPRNDDFTNAIAIFGTNLSVNAAFRGSTLESGEPPLATNATGSIWWKWSPNATNRVIVELVNSHSGFDLEIYSGDSLSNLVRVSPPAQSLPSSGLPASRIEFSPVEESYFVRLSHRGSQSDEITRLTIRPTPRNDDFANALILPPLTYTQTTALFHGATREPDELGSTYSSIWFSWTAPISSSFAIDVFSSTFTPTLEIYTGDVLTNLTPVSQNLGFGTEFVSLRASEGVTYHFRVIGHPSEIGSATIRIRPGPANDDFSQALFLEGSSITTSGSLLGATPETGELTRPGVTGSVWFFWTPTNSAPFSFDVSTAQTILLLEIFRGDSLTNLTLLSSGTNNGIFRPSARATALLSANEPIRIRVSLTYIIAGTGGFALTVRPAPGNDNFADAFPITDEVTLGSTRGATAQPGEDSIAPGTQSVWYRWKPNATGGYEFDITGAVAGNTLHVFEGDSFESLQLAFSMNSSIPVQNNSSFFADASRTYFIRINGSAPGGESFNLRISPASPHDLFAERSTITLSQNITASTTGAVLEPNEPIHDPSHPTRSLWWEWTCESSGGYYLEIPSLSYPLYPPQNVPAAFAIYQGTTLSNLVKVPFQTTILNGPIVYRTITAFHAVQGQKYQFAFWDHFARTLNFRFSETPAHDDFADAATLQQFELRSFDIPAATFEPGEPTSRYTIPTVWHKFTPPTWGSYVVRVTGGLPVVYRGTSLTNLAPAELSATNSPGQLSPFFAANWDPVYIAVHLTPPVNYSIEVLPGAQNDDFDQRLPIEFSSTITNATWSTIQTNEPIHSTNFLAGTLWWKWTPTNSGIHRIQALMQHRGAALALYTGTDLTNLTLIARVDAAENESPFIDVVAQAGVEYSIASTFIPWGETPLTLEIHTPPANDSFDLPQPLFKGETNSQTFVFATREPHEDWAQDWAGNKETLWYTWSTPSAQTATIVADTEPNSTVSIRIFTGSDPTNLTTIATLDNSYNGALAFQAQANAFYRIAIAVVHSVYQRTLNVNVQDGHPYDNVITPAQLSGTFVGWTNTTFGSTSEPFEAPFDSTFTASIWAQWTASEPGLFRILLNNARASVFALSETPGLHLVSTNVQGGVQFSAQAGTNYFIRVASLPDAMGPFSLRLGPPPLNENRLFPTPLTGDSVEVISQNWVPSLSSGDPYQLNGMVWYSWTAPANGLLSYSLSSNLLNPSVSVFHGKSPTIDSNIASPIRSFIVFPFPPPRTNFAVTENISYLFGIRGTPSTNFTFRLNFTPAETSLGSLNGALLGGDHLWFSQTNVFYSGPEALQAGPSTNREAWIELTFHGRGSVRFRTKLQGDGTLIVYSGPRSGLPFSISPSYPQHDWTLRTISFNGPTNVIRILVNPPSRRTAPITAWIDDIEFIPPPPQQPNLIFSLNPNDPERLLRLTFQLEANRSTTLDLSTNLIDWLPFTNLLSPSSSFRSFYFPTTNDTPQFFRARVEP